MNTEIEIITGRSPVCVREFEVERLWADNAKPNSSLSGSQPMAAAKASSAACLKPPNGSGTQPTSSATRLTVINT